MSLDLTKLDRVVELSDGVKRARCPACAESGSDRSGEHLRIYPDGKFGCCVHPASREHRQRIFALAGERKRRGIKVRVAGVGSALAVESGILGRLGRAFSIPLRPDAPDEANAVGCEISMNDEPRTLRTGEANWKTHTENGGLEPRTARTGQTVWTEELFTDERTLRTPQYSLVLQQTDSERDKNETCIYKGFQEGVRCVRLPYLEADGNLVIPFSAPERYFWWKGGQPARQTKQELLERKENDASPF
jgi:hypothetical protein